jgi:hypothetical protein
LEQVFPALGVRFISLNDNYDSATLHGMTGGIDIAFRNLIYDLYSQDLSEKVKSAKLSAAKNGKFTNAEVIYGYIRDPQDQRTLAIDEPAAAVVRRIFELFAQGNTSNAIAKMLNDDGIITPVERRVELGSRRRLREGEARFWYGQLVQRIINDEQYTGKLIYGKTHSKEVCGRQYPTPKEDWVVVPNAFPAIVSEEEFAAAQEYVKKRSNPNHHISPTKLLFARKIRCGCCGKMLKSIHRTHDVKYYCTTPSFKTEYGCMTDKVFENDIAAAVLSALQVQIALAAEAWEVLEREDKKLRPKIDVLKGEVSRLSQLIEKTKTVKVDLWEQYHSGKLTAEAFQRENEKADELAIERRAKVAELETEIRALESESGKENLFVERYSRQVGLTELTREVVTEFVREVKVYAPDRIEVVFNFADEYAKVMKSMGRSK